MPRARFTKQHAAALVGGLGLLALALLFYHSLAGGTLLAENVYDSYLLQAQNWLAGRIDIADGASRPWLELAVFEGRYYLSFPPAPSVLALPWAALGLSAGNLTQAVYALVALAGVYLCFWQQKYSPAACGFWAVFATVGSNFLWMACYGGVWMEAQALNLCFAVWGIFFYLRRQDVPAFFLLALTVGCRPFTALLAVVLFLRPLFECGRQRRWGRLAAVSALPLAAAVTLGWYNWARFGSPLEFGRAYLPEFAHEGYAQFSLTYLAQNLKNLLRPVTLDAALDLKFPMFDGFLPVAVTPLFLVWGAGQVRAVRKKSFDLRDGILLAGLVFTLLGLCTHRTFGGWQFGARYTMDLVPWALLFFLRHPPAEPGPGARWLCAAGVLFNFYGAVYLLSH